MTHIRNVTAMLASPRCCARTRSGAPCANPAVKGKTRCRMHGGAKGSGAPKGNTNALRTGAYTAAARAARAEVSAHIKQSRLHMKAMRAEPD